MAQRHERLVGQRERLVVLVNDLAHVGKQAPVTLPDGEVVKGHITEVGTVAEAAEGGGPEAGEEGGGEATISVTVSLDHPVARLDQAPVSVELVEQVSRHVLAVLAPQSDRAHGHPFNPLAKPLMT